MSPPEYYVTRDELEEAIDCLLQHGAPLVSVYASGPGYVVIPARVVDGCALREAT